MIIHFKSRFDREAIQGGDVRQKIKLQIGTAVFGGDAKQLARDHDGCFAVKFDDFGDRLRVPGTQLFGYNIIVLIVTFRHDLSDFAPVARYASRTRVFSKDKNSQPAGSRYKSSFHRSRNARGCEKPPPTGTERSLPRQKV